MDLDASAIRKGIAPAAPSSRGEPVAALRPKSASPASDPAAAATGERVPARPAPSPPADIRQQIEKLTRALEATQSNLSFTVDDSTGKTIVRVVRNSTGELVRQIPSEEALAIAASLSPGEVLSTLGLDRWT